MLIRQDFTNKRYRDAWISVMAADGFSLKSMSYSKGGRFSEWWTVTLERKQKNESQGN